MAQNVIDSSTLPPKKQKLKENDNQQHGNLKGQRVNFIEKPIVYEVAAHISENLLETVHEPISKNRPTKNYSEIHFRDMSRWERKSDIGTVTDVVNVSVPYSHVLVPMPKTCEYEDWDEHSDGLKSKTTEEFVKILDRFNRSGTKTAEGRSTRLFLHDTLLYPADIASNFRFCEVLNIGFPTSFDVYFKALEAMRQKKKNAYIMDRIYISVGCDLVMRAFNDKDCLNDVKRFLELFFKELNEDFGPSSALCYRNQGGFESISPMYPIVYIINVPIWKFKHSNIKNFNRRFEILNNYLKDFVQEKKSTYARFGLVVKLIDWNTLARENLTKSGIGSTIEDKDDSKICLDMRYAALKENLISIGELPISQKMNRPKSYDGVNRTRNMILKDNTYARQSTSNEKMFQQRQTYSMHETSYAVQLLNSNYHNPFIPVFPRISDPPPIPVIPEKNLNPSK